MRTTITFEPDTAAVVEQVRRERSVGISAAVNELIRRAVAAPGPSRRTFTQKTSAGHARMDLTDISAVLDLLDETDR